MTTSVKPDPSRRGREEEISVVAAEHSNSQRELDRRLDEALEETFPASDPISIVIAK
jgi:hypothetical protein